MKTFTAALVISNLALLVASQGTQFITGACNTDSDCASGCCGFNSGLCAGAVIAQTRDGGCGHGNATPNNNAALALGSTVAAPGVPAAGSSSATSTGVAAAAAPPATSGAAGSQNVGTGNGLQFITGACDSDKDCASACCASGLCSAVAVAPAKGGCGFVAAGTSSAAVSSAAAPPAAAPSASASSEDDAAGDENVGNGEGKQFITGKCDDDADCASQCCASGLCSAVAVAAAKGGCGFVANKREFWA